MIHFSAHNVLFALRKRIMLRVSGSICLRRWVIINLAKLNSLTDIRCRWNMFSGAVAWFFYARPFSHFTFLLGSLKKRKLGSRRCCRCYRSFSSWDFKNRNSRLFNIGKISFSVTLNLDNCILKNSVVHNRRVSMEMIKRMCVSVSCVARISLVFVPKESAVLSVCCCHGKYYW